MKRVLSVQDLSCVGRCSLTVALPVLSAMGCQCSVLPTGVLSTHTGFPGPFSHPLTEDIPQIAAHWQSQKISFDAIAVGYLASPQQAQVVEQVLSGYDCPVVVDPAMGDHGKLYSKLGPEHVSAMASVCRKGTYLLPNVTEAALLTDVPYRETPDKAYLQQLLEGLLDFGAEAVIITGVTGKQGRIGFAGKKRGEAPFFYERPCIPRQFHGTGDLFTAVFTGALLRGADVPAAAERAAGFVERCIEATKTVTPYGVEFETQLPYLWQEEI